MKLLKLVLSSGLIIVIGFLLKGALKNEGLVPVELASADIGGVEIGGVGGTPPGGVAGGGGGGGSCADACGAGTGGCGDADSDTASDGCNSGV